MSRFLPLSSSVELEVRGAFRLRKSARATLRPLPGGSTGPVMQHITRHEPRPRRSPRRLWGVRVFPGAADGLGDQSAGARASRVALECGRSSGDSVPASGTSACGPETPAEIIEQAEFFLSARQQGRPRRKPRGRASRRHGSKHRRPVSPASDLCSSRTSDTRRRFCFATAR